MKVERKGDELEFLPAALEILETPASPTGRFLTWLIAILFISVVTWGWFSKIDTEAVAQGKIIPGGQVKTIQALEIGTVRAIHVKEGQRVKAGELLIELDPTDSDANEERMAQDLLSARLDVARIKTLLLQVAGDEDYDFIAPEGVSESLELASRALLLQSTTEHRSQMASIDSQISQRQATYGMTQSNINKLAGVVPLLAERVSAREKLVKKKVGARTTFLQLKQELVEAEGNLEIEKYRLQEGQAELNSLRQQRAEREAAFLAEQQAALSEALQEQAALEQELRKAVERNRLRQLRAPVNGVVQQLAVHTVGGVVQAAQPVMVIVPEGTPLEIEAMVLNKDIGFVEVGQVSEIKVESFPYTKYGMIEGTVEQISADAIEDEKQGLIYKARSSMNTDKILVEDRWVPLTPGMSVTVEVKTGKRRAIEFFLAPFLKYQDEALGER
ncbi:hypothetical protein WH95_10980 [Kiloniella litopenaei]|uniref:Membrane fusion protein (MFP) family protein n=1 Tax=Kiloniella litopenaei TaxID=1549748 RepID=A0A0M2R8P9_9PROT|nr:hypothetical protein WH95_10980 [Kiloniella litopenaei]